MELYGPLLLIVGANTVYHICAKGTASGVNTFASVAVTYLVGAVLSLALYYATSPVKRLGAELAQMNWATPLLGLAIIGLEAGNLLMYKAGWDISLGSLLCNIALAVVLALVGVAAYGEHLSAGQLVGILMCLGGIVLVSRG